MAKDKVWGFRDSKVQISATTRATEMVHLSKFAEFHKESYGSTCKIVGFKSITPYVQKNIQCKILSTFQMGTDSNFVGMYAHD